MAKLALASFLLLLLSLSSVCNLGLAAGDNKGPWCIAKPLAPMQHLQNNINFACEHGVNCNEIWGNKKLPCFTTDTISRASLAMNAYYQQQGRKEWTCAFTNNSVPSGIIVTNDPNYDTSSKCFFSN